MKTKQTKPLIYGFRSKDNTYFWFRIEATGRGHEGAFRFW